MAPAQRGREIYIGVVTDDPFGPVITFGAGGTMIELINDRAMELPPLNQFLARRLIERSRVAETLGEWRGASAGNMEALEQRAAARVGDGVRAAAAARDGHQPDHRRRVRRAWRWMRASSSTRAAGAGSLGRHYSHLAILPYPARYEQVWPMRGGGEYTVRPIHPDDAQMLQDAGAPPVAGEPLLPLRVVDAPSCRRRCWRASR